MIQAPDDPLPACIPSTAQVLVMGLSERARRHHPWNLLGLGVFVACEALLVGTATAALDTDLLLLAFGLTGAITLGLAGFALQTRWVRGAGGAWA